MLKCNNARETHRKQLTTEWKVSLAHIQINLLTSLRLWPCGCSVAVWKNSLELREKSPLCLFSFPLFLLGGWPGTAVLFPVSQAAEATHTGRNSAPGWPHCGCTPRPQATARRQRPTSAFYLGCILFSFLEKKKLLPHLHHSKSPSKGAAGPGNKGKNRFWYVYF